MPALLTPVISEMWSRCDITTGDKSTERRFLSGVGDVAMNFALCVDHPVITKGGSINGTIQSRQDALWLKKE